jgi:predicted small metal-binding protein
MKTLKCACGWEVTGTEEEVITATQEHAEKLHNMHASREEVLSRIEVAKS